MATMSAQDFIIDAQELAEAQDLLDLIDPAELTVQMNDEGQYVAGRSSSSLPEEACSGSDGIPAVESAQHGAASSSFLCWGAVLKGDGGTSCEQSGFCPGKNHFKSKFCPACIKSIEIPSSRIRAMRAEMQGLFANSQRSGFWKNAPDSLGGGEVRIANNTITCDGPWLIIYKSLPPEHGLVQWEPMPDGWVEPATGMVRLSVCKGTLVPSCEMWRHTTGRKHAASSEAGESQSLVRHSWQIDSVPKRHRRAHSSSGSGAWPGGSSSAGGGSGGGGGGGSSGDGNGGGGRSSGCNGGGGRGGKGGEGRGASCPSSQQATLLPVVPTIAAAVPLTSMPLAVASPMVSEPTSTTTATTATTTVATTATTSNASTALDSTAAFSRALVAAHSEAVSLLETALHPNAWLRQQLSHGHVTILLANLMQTRGILGDARRIEAEIHAQTSVGGALPLLSQPSSQLAPGLPSNIPPPLSEAPSMPFESGRDVSPSLPFPATISSVRGSVQRSALRVKELEEHRRRPVVASNQLTFSELSPTPRPTTPPSRPPTPPPSLPTPSPAVSPAPMPTLPTPPPNRPTPQPQPPIERPIPEKEGRDETSSSSSGPQPLGMRRNDPIVAPAPFQFAVHGMELGAAHAGQVLFEMRIDILGGSSGNSLHRNEQLKERPPPVLSSLPPEAWAVVVKEMEEYQRLNGFYNCPNAEFACMYSGCCCCTMCVCWFLYAGYHKAPSDLMLRATKINRVLTPLGLVVEGDDRITHGKYLVFRVR